MKGDLGTFTADLSRWQAKLPGQADLLVQGFSQTVFNEVQSGGKYSPGTPIASGFARANWDGGVGAIPSNPPTITAEAAEANPAAGRAAAAEAGRRTATAILTAKAGDRIYLSNTARYIRRLEFGWSTQAPGGFIRLALNSAQAIADEVGAFLVKRGLRGAQ
jgi:hypothetical protein